jgi:ABC-type multidrug transport system fused ATPase/permease subunit
VLVVIQVLLALLDLVGVLLIGLVAALSASAISGQDPPVIGGLLDAVGLGSVESSRLIVVIAALAGTVLIAKSVFSFLLVRRSYRFLANRQAMVSSHLSELLLARPLLDVQRRSSQETVFALTAGVNSATIGVLGGAVVVAAEAAMLIVLAVGLLVVDPTLALFTIVFFALVGLTLNQVLGSWARRLGTQLSTAEIASMISIQDAVRTYREVSVSGRRGLFVERFQALRWRAALVQADVQVMNQVSKYVFEVALIVGGAALVVSQAFGREIVAAVAVLAVFLAAASRIMPSLLRMQQAVLGIRTSAGAAVSTFELHNELQGSDKDLTVDPELRARVLEGVTNGYRHFVPKVAVSDARLTYPGADRPAVDGVSFEVGEGTSLALVGPTGAGKSSIADLILGVIRPDSGAVLVSGLDPSVAIEKWPGAIAYVPQDIAVINGTVRDNVAFGLPDYVIVDELVWDSLSRAHLSGLLESERDGLDTIVGENGVRLSGGQRQRLGLARALYTKPRLLVLDEATSALDAETERAVSDALQELEGQVTLILVAHRLATIRNCSQVAYVEGGRIAALGDFDSVRREQPNFDRQAHLLGL